MARRRRLVSTPTAGVAAVTRRSDGRLQQEGGETRRTLVAKRAADVVFCDLRQRRASTRAIVD